MTSNSEQTLLALAKDIRAGHRAAVESARMAIEHAQRTGDLLIEAKELVPHGQWGEWLRRETGISHRTAQRYVQIARNAPPVAGLGIKAMADALALTRYKAVATATDLGSRWCRVTGDRVAPTGEQLSVPVELLRPNPHWPFGPDVDSAAVYFWEECARAHLIGDMEPHCLVSLLGYREGRSYHCIAHMPLYFGARRLWEQGEVSEVPVTVFPKDELKGLASIFAILDLWSNISWCAGERKDVPVHMIHAVRVAGSIANERGDPITPDTIAAILPCATTEDVQTAWTMAEMTGGVAYDIEG